MAEPPVYTPHDEQKQPPTVGYPPEGQAGAYPPQGQPGTYPPQGQPGAYPMQGQPGAYPQGAYPQGQPGAYPQGQPYYPQAQAVAYPAGQQMVITQPGNTTHVYHTGTNNQGCCSTATISEHYNGKAGFVTGVFHLVIAVLSIILGGAAYAFPGVVQAGYGIWSAIIFFIPTGILGVCSKRQNSCVIIAYMVMAILTTFHAFGMLAYEATVAAVFTHYLSCYYSYIGDYAFQSCDAKFSNGALAVHAVLAFLGLVEFIVCIVSAAFCCRGSACCCAPPPTNPGVGATTTTIQTQAQPMTVVTSSAGKYAPGP